MRKCETHLSSNLAISELPSMFRFAVDNQLSKLQMTTVDIINRFPYEVMGTDQWKELIEPNPKMLSILYHDLVQKNKV